LGFKVTKLLPSPACEEKAQVKGGFAIQPVA
jgi:hypothetical protein